MLSSFGFDKGVARTVARNNSKYVLEVPRGFSVHVFKNPTPGPAPLPALPAGKSDYAQNRDVTGMRVKQPPYPNRPEIERKPSTLVDARTSQLSAYARVFEPKRSKSQRPYGIYPSAIPDTYIYERSVSSASVDLSSDSSSTSSDEDLNPDSVAQFAMEVSSTRASSSTETLETTGIDVQANTPVVSAPSGPSSRSSPSPLSAQVPVGARLAHRSSQQSPSPTQSTSSRHATVEEAFDSDSETVISEGADIRGSLTPAHGTASSGPSRGLGTSLPLSTPLRRSSEDDLPRQPRNGPIPPRENCNGPPTTSLSLPRAGSSSPPYDESLLRAPPGLQPSSSSRPTGSRSSDFISPKSQNLSDQTRAGPSSDPACILISTNKRCVRWTENLVCPSPVPAMSRRKGWYNRRGDQLWTNDGKFKSPEAGQEYPADLSCYPDPNAGWMNEDGVRIDMQHRLIPKPPLRSALKRPKTPPTQANEYNLSSNAPLNL